MRSQACLLLFAAALVIVRPAPSAAYAPHGIVVPETREPAPGNARPFGQTTGEKSDLPPLPARNGDASEDDDPHDAPSDAMVVPFPHRAGVADVRYDVEALPPAVARTRQRLIEAARSGDIDALRPIFEDQPAPPLVEGFSDTDDPVAHLRNQSGDAEGREILAILLEILEAGYVRIGPERAGTYVWPYFAEVPLDELEGRHYVEVYRILTSLDVEELLRIGAYTFYRVGISHDGRIRYFSAGLVE